MTGGNARVLAPAAGQGSTGGGPLAEPAGRGDRLSVRGYLYSQQVGRCAVPASLQGTLSCLMQRVLMQLALRTDEVGGGGT